MNEVVRKHLKIIVNDMMNIVAVVDVVVVIIIINL